MKHSLFFLAMCLMCCACSSDENIGGTSAVKNISATLEPMTFDGLTRTSHTVSDTQGFLSEWAEGDILGIYPVGGDQVAFPISAGAGTSTAKFDGGSWALRPAVKYSAYYPFSKDNYMISQTEIPVNYEGQSQNGNASTAHLGNYYYVAAAAAEPTSTGSVNLAMKHMGSLLNLILTMPVAASYSNVVVETETEGEFFPTTGTIDLTSAAPAITPKTYAHSIHLGLTNVSTAAANQTISLLMMMAPANMQDKDLLVTVTDTEGKTYQFKGAGKTYLAAKAYRLTLTEVIGGTGANLTPDGWDDSDANMHNGHEYVDLGLPSGTLWATCNVGATKPEDPGLRFAWGETSSKDNFTLNNYAFWNGSSTSISENGYGATKYNSTDGLQELALSDDAAYMNWGNSWITPSKEECDELRTKCTWTQGTLNDVDVWIATGPNGKSIYFALAPYSGSNPNVHAMWNRTLHNDKGLVYKYYFSSFDGHYYTSTKRYEGNYIRPVVRKQDPFNGHEYVDLGIKDEQGRTIYWATCNVGANSPEEYGDYFAWGETIPYYTEGHSQDSPCKSWRSIDGRTITGYDWASYKYCNGEYNKLTKYCSDASSGHNGYLDNNLVLAPEDDAATVNWGGNWHTPTMPELETLRTMCTWSWTAHNGVEGCEVVGPNGKSIFLPASGSRFSYLLQADGTRGYYWSSSLSTNDDSSHAFCLCFNTSTDLIWGRNGRNEGRSVRPVCIFSK